MRVCFFFALMALAMALAAPSSADGLIIVDPPPDVQLRLDQALTIKYHHVDIKIKDQVATTHVDQVFRNDNPWAAEGTYIFPLPEGAAVNDFVMWVDGQPVRGQILEAEEARTIYNDVVRRMKDPALLEYVGRRALKASVFPIPSGGERRIELEYSQVLPAEGGLVHYSYPLSTERFSKEPLEDLLIKAEIESKTPIKAVYSSSHDVSVDRNDDYHARLGLEQAKVLPDKDFDLYYTVSTDKIGLNLLSYKEPHSDGFFLLLAAPNLEVNKSEVVAKDLLLVLDTSGSMDGEKLDQAKLAADFILDRLNPQDRFGIVAFSTGVRAYSSELSAAGEAGAGWELVERLEAMGSTDINRALKEAVAMADKERPTTLIFLTDGLPTEGVTDVGQILSNIEDAPKNVRIFCFGVGDDVDTDLLDQLSADHGGTSTYVRAGQKIDEEVGAFYAKVSNPVLSDVELDFGNISTDQLFPERMPDVFAGSQAILVGRYREGGPSRVVLSGTVNGEKRSFNYPDIYFSKEGGDSFIPRLWATRAVGYYLTQIRLKGERQEWIDTIVGLSTRFGIITPYTSFLIEERDIFTEQGRGEIAQGVQQEMAREAAMPSYGAGAVQKAVFQGALSAAPAAPSLSSFTFQTDAGTETVKVSDAVKYAGSKTFVLRNQTWIDTEYSGQETEKVKFLSEDYFDLISGNSDLRIYFALGSKVIVVYKDVAYEVES
jgi:Ca-activated chloride channel family protein